LSLSLRLFLRRRCQGLNEPKLESESILIKNMPEYHPACWVDEWHSLYPGGRGLG
jgi:hypothetical protein